MKIERNGCEKQLFIAVATGQNVANLPPILHFAREKDEVVWLESHWAKKQEWAKGAIQVLKARELHSHRVELHGDINDPKAVYDSVHHWLVHHHCYDRLNVILNGGQKLTPFGLALAARDWHDKFGKPVRFLYGDDQPACVQVREQQISEKARSELYIRENMLTLEEILQVNGRQMLEPAKTLDWNQPGDPGRYGRDLHFTALVHAYATGPATGAQNPKDIYRWPGYCHWAEQSKQHFHQQFSKLLERSNMPPIPRDKRSEFYKSLVKTVRNFSPQYPRPEIPDDKLEQLVTENWWTSQHRQNIGPAFEHAVANRVVRFLNKHPESARVVRELRCNVRVQHVQEAEEHPHRNGNGIAAEWDVVLVLTNGIILNFECKSWQADKKDLDAREQVMTQAASQLARLYVVMPLMPEFANEPWFEEAMYNKFKNAQGYFRGCLLTYTMEEEAMESSKQTPKSYSAGKRSCPWPHSFESSLQKILDRFAVNH